MAETPVDIPVMPGKNGGTLRRGGINPHGNGGRPKSEVRQACVEGFHKALPILLEIATGEKEVSQSERLKAIDLLGKYGGLQQTDVTTNDQAVKPVVVDVSGLGMDVIDAILAKEDLST